MKYQFLIPFLLFSVTTFSQQEKAVSQKVDSLLSLMTLEEKIGQMTQRNSPGMITGPVGEMQPSDNLHDYIVNKKMGSLLGPLGAENTRALQQLALDSTRLGIPLLFGFDVIHGFRTISPIPLAEAASFDLEAIEKSARVAAEESTAVGLHWTLAPMVDIALDPRWGRIAEGAGEDPWWASQVAKARVRGFQGNDLSDSTTVAACAKHFLAYGAAEAGKDYNTTDVSERRLREIYLPPFQACIEAGVATLMSGFNELNGVPTSGTKKYLYELLRKEWGFEGLVLSDWASIKEMIAHGAAKNDYEAAWLALEARIDVEMVSQTYLNEAEQLLKDGHISMDMIDESVRRILTLKYELGLFDDPFKYCDPEREKQVLLSEENKAAALDMAKKSIVLLKNDGDILPLEKKGTIALIGPLADPEQKGQMNGTWSAKGRDEEVVSILDGLTAAAPQAEILFSKGCDIDSEDRSGFAEAVATARKADVVLLAVGESKGMSGEARTRSNIQLPGLQQELIAEILETGKPVVLLLTNGRPLDLSWEHEHVPAILETWFLGTMAGPAIAEVVFGDYNPSGKLPVTFPRSLGQTPIYYYTKNTGRPLIPGANKFTTSRYLDMPNTPLYPFGYGLSYTTFDIGRPVVVRDTFPAQENKLQIYVKVKNTGEVAGKETVQLYIRDLHAFGVGRPVKELKGFQQVALQPGEEQVVRFELTTDDLKYYRRDMSYGLESGEYKVFVGGHSQEVEEAGFYFKVE